MRNEFPSACVDVVEYYLCMLGSPPCDPNAGGRPMLICDKDCEAYTALERDDVCDDTKAYAESFAMDARNFDVVRVLELFNKFDCTNVSTYYFFERDGYSDMCTGILSDESRGWSIQFLHTHSEISLYKVWQSSHSYIHRSHMAYLQYNSYANVLVSLLFSRCCPQQYKASLCILYYIAFRSSCVLDTKLLLFSV